MPIPLSFGHGTVSITLSGTFTWTMLAGMLKEKRLNGMNLNLELRLTTLRLQWQ